MWEATPPTRWQAWCRLMPAERAAAELASGGRRVHVVGIGGAGMSAIATVLASIGHRVTGSDLKASPVTERLANQGITVVAGHRAENVGDADIVTASPAVMEIASVGGRH